MSKTLKPPTAERMLQITNDIVEDIDNGESRHELRECVRYWSNEAIAASRKLAVAEGKIKLYRTFAKILE